MSVIMGPYAWPCGPKLIVWALTSLGSGTHCDNILGPRNGVMAYFTTGVTAFQFHPCKAPFVQTATLKPTIAQISRSV
jgi:hypothetical protein